jgi:ABC-type bacteriocin/lantibiotic exporter with double-glycine peptidase domain
MIDVVRKAFRLLSHKRRWAALLPLLLTVLAETVGTAAVFVLVRIVAEPAAIGGIPVAATIAEVLPWRDERSVILCFTVLVAAFYLAKNALSVATDFFRNRTVASAAVELSSTMVRGYLRAPYTFHLQRNSAQLIHTAIHSVYQVMQGVISPLLTICTEALVVVGIVGVLLIAAPQVTIIITAILSVFSFAILRTTKRGLTEMGSRAEVLHRTALQSLQQAFGLVKEVRILGRWQFFADTFAAAEGAYSLLHSRRALLFSAPRSLVEIFFICGALLVIVLVTLRGTRSAETVSLLGLYAYAGFRIIPSVKG